MDKFSTFRNDFWHILDQSKKAIVTAHFSPDDDSIGSVLSLFTIIKRRLPDLDLKIVYGDKPIERFESIPGYDKIEFVEDIAFHLAGVDTLIVADVNTYDRFTNNRVVIESIQNKIVIDHHASKPDYFKLSMIEPAFSSNCELIYTIFEPDFKLDKELASMFLLGILGDTGSFNYVLPSQAAVFDIVKKLVQAVDQPIGEFKIPYSGISENSLLIIRELVNNMILAKMDGWPNFLYSFLEEDILEAGYTSEEISAASHIFMSQYINRVQGFTWGFVITPRMDGTCRISSRSLLGSVNVRDLHERLGVGGGHDRASGGKFDESDAKTCLTKVITFMNSNKPKLN